MTTIERIKKISKERGWSLQKVAEKAGIGVNSIYRWNTKTPSTASLQAVADVLDVSVDYLLGKDDKPSTSNEPVDLDKVLSDEGMAMFDGKPLSEEYKKALLAMLRANKNSGE
ncbi:helix-turn-helix domain-containing protein [Pediococcus acidilactici]|uniref:XRE family transcriptional regulator n=1 Tax=Pediococcus acidilactici TaxID=1254 RepID=UPI00132893C8|nr:XRE family transcriptional regulator [Pediococcus acidilactici]KAF0387752.1 helix-turn-helix domain-containing protein [Pediococcus acidilactici]KAF0554352.1 helix-turn-helix domain-containing protein [Pediococcus acidilactici]KAF0567182.1 helix-turn-helix domain-containing protein [Pediococcus acidilactici]KAF0801534.1 helix-turn-helix domain-containing protein [Pediococcus acidilactici]